MDESQRIINVNIDNEMKRSFLDYSMSVIVARALPDARDGLKPVHRRILYTLFENNLTFDKPYRKCADTVGSVLGRYHPHGDSSVYDALVRLAQNFSTRYMLVDGHGNFGSIDGDPPAAYRYTESRMSKIAAEILTDIDKETVDFVPNYDDRLKEPKVLPSRFPNLLVNGSSGIAVGMATNIPPHNLGEVIDGIEFLIDNPEGSVEEIMKFIKGPDFPTGASIMGTEGIKSAYRTGRGKIKVRATTEIIQDGSRSKIVVTQIPYQLNKTRLIESISDLIKDKKIETITKIEDHSDRNGMHIEITVRSGASANLALNQLYSLSSLQMIYGIIMLAIVDGEPKVLNLKDALNIYINFQIEVITRRTKFDLSKSQDRIHILMGLKIATDNIDEVVSILKNSKSISEGKENLAKKFDFTEVQTQAIVQMPLGKLTNLEQKKIEEEINQLKEKIAYFESILNDKQKLLSVLKDEISQIKKKFGDARRTEILMQEGEIENEDLIPHTVRALTFTKMGYIKNQNIDSYNIQKRGGRGVNGMTQREDDSAGEIILADSHDYILFFSNFGKVFILRCYEIPEGSKISKGLNVINLLNISQNEKITSLINISEFSEDKYLMMATKFGVIKKTSLSSFSSVRKNGLTAIILDEDDELVLTKVTDGTNFILISTYLGKSVRFNEADVRSTNRASRGVRSMKLAGNDYVVSMIDAADSSYILTVSETGFGRISLGKDFRITARGGSGIINYRVKDYGNVAATININLQDDILIISSTGIIIRIKADSIRQCARPSKGVKIMKLSENSKIVSVMSVKNDIIQT